jgi:hypothetical protein
VFVLGVKFVDQCVKESGIARELAISGKQSLIPMQCLIICGVGVAAAAIAQRRAVSPRNA